jgi:hypothetical protein
MRSGYIPFEPEAANLFFQLVSSRYERASLIVTSNKPFGRWGEVFGDEVVAAAMIDRLVHHAEVAALKGDSHRLKTETSAASSPTQPTPTNPRNWSKFTCRKPDQISVAVDTDEQLERCSPRPRTSEATPTKPTSCGTSRPRSAGRLRPYPIVTAAGQTMAGGHLGKRGR